MTLIIWKNTGKVKEMILELSVALILWTFWAFSPPMDWLFQVFHWWVNKTNPNSWFWLKIMACIGMIQIYYDDLQLFELSLSLILWTFWAFGPQMAWDFKLFQVCHSVQKTNPSFLSKEIRAFDWRLMINRSHKDN